MANISFTKNESQSQPTRHTMNLWTSCGKYQFYKERKPITTDIVCTNTLTSLWQISVFTKNESQSQQRSWRILHRGACGKYQFYKERKPITTPPTILNNSQVLWQISVLQRTKANHNSISLCSPFTRPVANISFTKNESQSQLTTRRGCCVQSCGKYQFYKERKPITTAGDLYKPKINLWQISVLQRTKANHNCVEHAAK